MAQIPILQGVFTDGVGDFRISYPVNLTPVPQDQGISKGYLRPADGIVSDGTGPGIDRGGINWNGVCYRVMGTSFVRVNADSTVTTIGDVGSGGTVTMDYSFDRLAIASGGRLYYWDGSTLSQVTDADLGTALDVLWVDGYFMTTDGTFLVVTELTNPDQIDPLKYGSSEIDPDPIKSILKLRNEVYALNRNTIEVFDNVGGTGFPFQRIEGAQMQKGVVGTHACAVYSDQIAFLGSGRNEAPSIYLGANAGTAKIATREIDILLTQYTEAELSAVVMEARVDKGLNHLWVHLPDRTLVFDGTSSQVLQQPVWFVLTSTLDGFSQYRARNLVYAYDRWICGDPQSSALGRLTDTLSSQYGTDVRWEFGTLITYNEGRGAIVHDLELVCLTGRVAFGLDPTVSTSYSLDGVTWSNPRPIKAGKQGDRAKRLLWMQQGNMRNWRIQRFQGDTQSFISLARLEARFEPLAY